MVAAEDIYRLTVIGSRQPSGFDNPLTIWVGVTDLHGHTPSEETSTDRGLSIDCLVGRFRGPGDVCRLHRAYGVGNIHGVAMAHRLGPREDDRPIHVVVVGPGRPYRLCRNLRGLSHRVVRV